MYTPIHWMLSVLARTEPTASKFFVPVREEIKRLEVYVVERIFSSSRDVEGSVYNSTAMNTDSREFEEYLERFHVLDKYRKGDKAASYHGQIHGAGRLVALYRGYFSGWFRDMAREKPIWERRYIEIVEQIKYRN